ncbi:MAG: guanylate kinase [Chloroflexi bacterium]|nr:guanylate kinase [Chloroflexota bacterium]
MTQSYGSGQIFVLVGPGGAGKNTLMKMVLPRIENLSQLATATTRAIRPGEQENREHLFVSLDTFNQWIQDGKLLEFQEVHPGRFYGVPRAPLEEAFREGRDLIADIEIAGAEKILAAFPDNTVLIFIAAPSLDVLERRMRERGESEQGVRDRMARAEREMAFAMNCPVYIVNHDLDKASEELEQAILKARETRKVEA